MKYIFALFAILFLPLSAAHAAPVIGEAAPAFSGHDVLSGHDIALEDFKGKTVVLEWSNHGCPFVGKHYESGNMQALQKKYVSDDLVWIVIVSSAPGKQGNVTEDEAIQIVKDQGAAPSYKLLDESGEIGRAYGAKATPHMFVIDKEGILRYQGAIDDQPSPRLSSVEGADNYVVDALEALAAGKEIAVTSTQPYGCAVKY